MTRLDTIKEMAVRISFVFLRFALILLLFAAAGAAQSPAPNFNIDLIAIEGNRILSTPAILRAAGLKSGDPGGAPAFDAARDRLLASGYFETVSYRYKPSTAKGYEVTFEVQEIQTLYPVRVEALPASTEEITAFLKSKDPLFTGRMPGTKQVLDRTSHEIEQYLVAKGEAAQIAGRVIAVAPGEFEIDFAPARGLPAVASVNFEGSKAISAIDLHNKMNDVAFGQPFSEASFRVLLNNQIRALYEAKGYMRVTFPRITTQPATDVQGLDVKVTVDEGPQYKLSKVSIPKMPQIKITNLDQIKDGEARVKARMRHEGYLDAEVTTDKQIDDANKTVEYIIGVDSGPLYTFGKLTVNGLGLDGEAAIRKMWSVNGGDPFPIEYPAVFVAKVKEAGLFDNLGDATAKPDINRGTHIVNVTLDFKVAPQNDKPARRPGEISPGARRLYFASGELAGAGRC